MGNNFKKIRLKKLREPGNKYFNQGIDIALTELAGDEKTTVHLLKFDKNLIKKIKNIIKDGVANILFQPYVGKRRRPDVVLVSRGNKYYELEMRFGDAISETNLVELLKKTFQTKDKLKTSIQKFQETITNDPTYKALQKVKEETEKHRALIRKSLSIPNLDKTDVNKELTKYALTKIPDTSTGLPPKPKDIKNADGSITTFVETWHSYTKKWAWEPIKQRVNAEGKKVSFYKNRILTDGKKDDGKADFLEWCFDNDIDMWDMWKHYKKHKSEDKRYKPKNWADLIMVLNSLNFNPTEILNMAIDKTQTKTQFLEHRLYRSIKQRETYALRSFINVLRQNKLPDKALLVCPDMKKWMNENRIYFESPENLRQHKNTLIETYNKMQLYPPYETKKSKKKTKK